MTSLPPLGCLPATRTLFGATESGCVSRINTDAQAFNKKISSAATNLQKQLPGLKIVVFDIYKPLFDLVQTPSNSGIHNRYTNKIKLRVIIIVGHFNLINFLFSFDILVQVVSTQIKSKTTFTKTNDSKLNSQKLKFDYSLNINNDINMKIN